MIAITVGDLLSNVKRLRALQTEQKVFLSLAGLRSKQTCQRIVTHFADRRATQLQLEHLPASQTSPTNSSSNAPPSATDGGAHYPRTTVVSALTPELRRVCAVLGAGPLAFSHLVMKKLVGLGCVGLAMQVAATMTEEDQSLSHVHSSGRSNAGGFGPGATGNWAGEEVGVLLDAAVSLCSLAGGSAASTQAKSTRGAPAVSASAVAEPFLVSRALLRSAGTPSPLSRSLPPLSTPSHVSLPLDPSLTRHPLPLSTVQRPLVPPSPLRAP